MTTSSKTEYVYYRKNDRVLQQKTSSLFTITYYFPKILNAVLVKSE